MVPMPDESDDQKLYRLIREALVAPGLRPRTLADTEKMLRACAGGEQSEQKFRRMLNKVKGKLPLGQRDTSPGELAALPLTEAQRELVALHRAQGKELPSEVLKMLEEFRARVRHTDPPREGT
jgi:hypothetical protein